MRGRQASLHRQEVIAPLPSAPEDVAPGISVWVSQHVLLDFGSRTQGQRFMSAELEVVGNRK